MDTQVIEEMPSMPTPIGTPRIMDFYDALREVGKGKSVTKLEWQDARIFVYLMGSRLVITKEDGKSYDFLISDGDMGGEDWVVC